MRGWIGLIGVTVGFFLLFVIMRFSIDHTHMTGALPHHAHGKLVAARGTVKPQEPATFEVVDPNGEFRGLKVIRVAKGGVADAHFGLLPGDVVIGIGPFEMGDSTLVDFNAARDWIADAYERTNVTIRVERNGEELSLPIGGDVVEMAIAAGGADGSGDPSDKSPQITNPGGDE